MKITALILGLAAQTPYAATAATDVYSPPVVRPFEPSEAFALTAPVGAATRERPLERAVTLDRFSRDYEAGPEPLDAAYQQGVRAAEASADALAGPLDGGWLVMDGDRAQGRIVLSDPGTGVIEGAWAPAGAAGQVAALTGRRDGDRAELAVDGRSVRLRHTVQGWTGTWGDVRVTLRRGL